jgi:hypothetical protein
MKFSAIIASALLPLVILSSPLEAIRDASPETRSRSVARARNAEAESARIFKRATCDIVHVATTVDCWYYPTHGHASDGNYVVHSFAGTANNIKFTCYARCENVHDITYVFASYAIK